MSSDLYLPQGSNVKQTVSDTEEDYSPHDKDVRLTLLEEVILVGIKDKEVHLILDFIFVNRKQLCNGACTMLDSTKS